MRIFLTDFRYTERAAAEVSEWECVTLTGDWLGGIAERLAGKVGFEDDHMSVRTLDQTGGETRPTGVEPVAAGGAVEALRRVKDAERAGGDRRGLEARRRGAGATLEAGFVGKTERAVADAFEAQVRGRRRRSPSTRSSPPARTAPSRTPSPASA